MHLADIILPPPESENGDYLAAVAKLLASPDRLPEPLLSALLAIERIAAPENQACLDTAIALHLPCVSFGKGPSVDRALELWFYSPEILFALAGLVTEDR